ncbi:MAG: hypothetical protein HDS66_01545 [Bacteroidales bacterium]|nr:hypothetical protein [Bacteroidales bacterium]
MAITSINDPWECQPRREIETVLKNELSALRVENSKLQGKIDLISLESGAVSTSEFLRALMGGVKIAFHRKFGVDGAKGDGAPLAIGIDKWAQYAGWGNRADGVLVLMDGGEGMLVGLGQGTQAWSALNYQNCGGKTELPLIRNRAEMSRDMDGQRRTALILANEQQNYGNADFERYAAGWCSVFKSDSVGVGKWWLPAIGELMAIMRHVDAINICIDTINANLHDGEELVPKIGAGYYLSSSEYSMSSVWVMEMTAGFAFQALKNGSVNTSVLPVTSLDVFMGGEPEMNYVEPAIETSCDEVGTNDKEVIDDKLLNQTVK